MELPSKRRIGGGLLLTAGAVLGREFIAWGFGKALDAGVSLARSAATGLTMPSSINWVNVLSLLLIVAGGWLLLTSCAKQRMPNNQLLDRQEPSDMLPSQTHFPEGLYVGRIDLLIIRDTHPLFC